MKKTVKKKVWAVIWTLKPEVDIHNLYRSKKEAQEKNRMDVLKYHKIIPITLTYSP